MQPEDVRARRKALRLSVAELARLSGVDKHTIHRTQDGLHSPVNTTLRKISSVIIAEERRVLRHLMALHPDESALPLLPLPPLTINLSPERAVSSPAPEPAPAGAPLSAAGALYTNGRAA